VNLSDLKKICAEKLLEFEKTAEDIKYIEESSKNVLFLLNQSARARRQGRACA
jgi:hypothetical protein